MLLPTFNALSTVLDELLSKKSLSLSAAQTIACALADDNDVYPPEEPLS